MYHPHADETRQQQAGLSGTLLVVDELARFDSAHDKVVLLTVPRANADGDRVLINGSLAPDTLRLRVGERYRLRIVDVHTYRPSMIVRLRSRLDAGVVARGGEGRDGSPPRSRDGASRGAADGERRDLRLRADAERAGGSEARGHDGGWACRWRRCRWWCGRARVRGCAVRGLGFVAPGRPRAVPPSSPRAYTLRASRYGRESLATPACSSSGTARGLGSHEGIDSRAAATAPTPNAVGPPLPSGGGRSCQR